MELGPAPQLAVSCLSSWPALLVPGIYIFPFCVEPSFHLPFMGLLVSPAFSITVQSPSRILGI